MANDTSSAPLRERTRRAVQAELVDVAQELFVEHGYEAVTVEQIAAAAGMSKRSFFRYFAGKDALVLGKYDHQGEALAAALQARPASEAHWTALRRMFDGVIDYMSEPRTARRAAELDRVINGSEALRAGYLERMQRAQQSIVEVLDARSGHELAALDAAALVAAAFAALSTARDHSRSSTQSLADSLDAAMSAISRESATES